MIDQAELEEVDRYYVERISRHIDFPNNEQSLKLFRQYRNKILKKQIASDDKRFRIKEFLENGYLQVKQEVPDLDLTTRAGAILFAKSVLGTVLEITAYREASMSFMLQIYESAMELGSGNPTKPNLKRIK